MTADQSERFELRSTAPKPKPLRFENDETRQRMLLSGLDCLEGQQDLFATDGERDEE